MGAMVGRQTAGRRLLRRSAATRVTGNLVRGKRPASPSVHPHPTPRQPPWVHFLLTGREGAFTASSVWETEAARRGGESALGRPAGGRVGTQVSSALLAL